MNFNIDAFLLFSVLMILIFSASNTYALASYYEKSPTGWHWNNQDLTVTHKKRKQKTTESVASNPIQEMKKMHEVLRFYKDRAVLNPTVSNIRDYLVVQNWMMQQSTLFEANWQKAMLMYPQFNYGITHPTDSLVSQISQETLHQNQVNAVKAMSTQYGILYFYDGKNPLSSVMEKTLIQFSKFYDFSVIAVSMDGVVIKSDLSSRINKNQAQNLGVKALPALVLVNLKNSQSYILSYGYSSVNQIIVDCYQVYKKQITPMEAMR